MKSILITLASITLLWSCTSEPSVETVEPTAVDTVAQIAPTQYKQNEVINKPFNDIDVPFKTFKYNNKRANSYELASGTLIEIPKNAFVDVDGNPIKGDVEIQYREMHDISDIMLSGIKMNYQDSDFESAGMFEIRANQEGKELKLADDKEIDIEMASFRSGDFDAWVMDEEQKEWSFIDKSVPKPNTRKTQKIAALDSSKNVLQEVCSEEPRKLQAGDQFVDLNFELNRHHELELFQGAMWLIKGGKKEEDRFRNDRKKYNDLSLTPVDTSCNDFVLSLWNRRNWNDENDTNKTHYTVEPVWDGNEYELAKKDYKKRLKAYKKEAKRIEKERRAAEREADLVRSFKLKGMGIYNCDRTIDYIKMVAAGIIISCSQKIKNWWYITMNKKVAIKYFAPNDPNFKYNPNSDNSIIAVLPNDEIGIVTDEELKKSYNEYRKSSDPNKVMEVEMQLKGESAADRQEFKKHISRF